MDLDLSSALSSRFRADDHSTVGFYDRSKRRFDVIGQREFLDLAAGTAAVLEQAGVVAGDVVGVVGASPEALWRGFLAAVLTGAVPLIVPVRPSLDGEDVIQRRLGEVVQAVPTIRFLVQCGPSGPCVAAPGEWIGLDLDASPGDALGRLEGLVGDPDRPLHLQLTSGSTGIPKPVVMTHRNAMSSTFGLNERMEARPGDHVVSWLPLYHDMGLMGKAVLSLVSGANLRLLSPFDFLSDPMHWLDAISTLPGAITAAPNFALAYATRRVSDAALARLDLRDWKKCYCGAEPVDPATVAAFIDRFAPAGLDPTVVHPTYGLAEATLMVTSPRTGDAPKQLSVDRNGISAGGPIDVFDLNRMDDGVVPDPSRPAFACLGTPAEGIVVEIVDTEGTVVDTEDYCGQVVVSGPAVSPGYLRPDGSIESFGGQRCFTGDLGFFHGGELYLVERLKNIIIVNGQNHSAGALEQSLVAQVGVPLDSSVVLQRSPIDTATGVVAVLEAPRGRDAEELLASVQAAIRAQDLPINDVCIVKRGVMPRTTSGKKQPAKLRLDLANGLVRSLAQSASSPVVADAVRAGVPPAEDVEIEIDIDIDIDIEQENEAAVVFRIIEDHARRRGWDGSSVDANHLLVADLGLDSLALIEISLDIETQIGRGIGEDQLANLSTAGDVVRLVATSSQPSVRISDLLHRLVNDVPQVYRKVTAQKGRQLQIDGRWINDFASLNYLGLDLCREVIDSVAPALGEWGVHPSWTRAVASPAPYDALERDLAELCGADDVMVFSTITLLHFGVLPKLATAADTLIVDHRAHNSIHEAAELAAARGATLASFDHDRLETLDEALRDARGRPVIALNGVYSMTGEVPDLAAIHERAVAHGAILYIDDAHGLGIFGGGPTADDPQGFGGGGVVRHANLGYDNIVYVAGMSKAFSSMAAFVTCRDRAERQLFETASTSIFSGPIPVASLASARAGLAVNRREGDHRRAILRSLTTRLVDGAIERGYQVENELLFPVVNLGTGGVERTIRASQIMWEHGVLFTPSIFPAAPLDHGGFRLSVTYDNTDDELECLFRGLDAVAEELGAPPIATGEQRPVPSQ